MEDEKTEQPAGPEGGLDIPETVQEETRNIVSGAFRLFADHNQRLADDLTEFNEKRKQVRENIERGARRTTGRIV
jgi:hypothetical protein